MLLVVLAHRDVFPPSRDLTGAVFWSNYRPGLLFLLLDVLWFILLLLFPRVPVLLSQRESVYRLSP